MVMDVFTTQVQNLYSLGTLDNFPVALKNSLRDS